MNLQLKLLSLFILFTQSTSFERKSYIIYSSHFQYNYNQAELECKRIGGKLARIESMKELEFITSQIGEEPFFVAQWLSIRFGEPGIIINSLFDCKIA